MSEDAHITELMARNPCSGYYQQAWLVNAWMEERGLKKEGEEVWCIHCKTCPGCPGCDDRVLSYWGINSLQRWNPEAYFAVVGSTAA